jgi:glutathione S-transferase
VGLEKALGVMDAALAKTPFLAGETFTLADVVYMPYVDYLMGSPVKDVIAKFPHVGAWWKGVSDRPAWAKATGRA